MEAELSVRRPPAKEFGQLPTPPGLEALPGASVGSLASGTFISDVWLPEWREKVLLLFQAPQFVVLHCSSLGKEYSPLVLANLPSSVLPSLQGQGSPGAVGKVLLGVLTCWQWGCPHGLAKPQGLVTVPGMSRRGWAAEGARPLQQLTRDPKE